MELPDPYDLFKRAEDLVNKMDEVHNDPQFKSVWVLAMIHGNAYKGETYTLELEALRRELLKYKGDNLNATTRYETTTNEN